MTKSKARAPGRLTRHLARTDTNEQVAIGASRDVTPALAEAMDELALRGATVAARKTLFHAIGNPEPGQLMTERGWHTYWAGFEDEFKLEAQPFVEVRHTKHGRDHRHRVYSLVRDDGRLVSASHNYRRNELVSRVGEVAAGHPLRPGRHHRWVVGEFARRGMTVSAATQPAETAPARPLFTQDEHQQAERRLGDDPRAFKARIYALYIKSGGSWRTFAALLDRERITVARGDSVLLVVDERTRFRLPLARLLREQAKRAGRPIAIRSADLEAVFGRAKPLAEEQEAIDRRWRGAAPAPQSSERAEAPAPAPAQPTADLFATRMRAAAVEMLAREARRAERLRHHRARKAALRRGALDSRVAAIADQLCVVAAAQVVQQFRSRNALRTTVLIVAALASGSAVAPTVLAAAAVALLRRGELKAERSRLRADVDAAKAGRTGWRFADVAAGDRTRYAALARSDLIDPEGPDAGPIIAALGRKPAARFVAWWAYATPKQRAVVVAWGKTRAPMKAKSRPSRSRNKGPER